MRVLLILIVLVTQQPSHPEEYPRGWYCTPTGTRAEGLQTTDHPCACKRMATCEGEGEDEIVWVAEDPICKQYCHKDKCSCPVTCAEC